MVGTPVGVETGVAVGSALVRGENMALTTASASVLTGKEAGVSEGVGEYATATVNGARPESGAATEVGARTTLEGVKVGSIADWKVCTGGLG